MKVLVKALARKALQAMLGAMFFAASLGFGRAHAQQTCADLFQTTNSVPTVATGLWSGVREAGRALYSRVRRSKVEEVFESSFTRSERRILREFAEGVRRPEMRSRESQDPFFLYILFSETPAATRAVLSRVLDSKLISSSSAHDLMALMAGVPVRSGSFLETVIENWVYDTRGDSRSFERWMTDLQAVYRKRENEGEFHRSQFLETLNLSRARMAASEFWREDVPLSRFGIASEVGSEVFIDGRLLGQVVGTEGEIAILRVPRASIKRAAWNPLSSEVLRKKIEDGFPKVRTYEAFLAADGYFYLLDGNHRFHLDNRQEVLIGISRPIAVSSLSATLDALGISQPKIENLVLYHQGKITLEDLIGEDAAKPLALVKRP